MNLRITLVAAFALLGLAAGRSPAQSTRTPRIDAVLTNGTIGNNLYSTGILLNGKLTLNDSLRINYPTFHHVDAICHSGQGEMNSYYCNPYPPNTWAIDNYNDPQQPYPLPPLPYDPNVFYFRLRIDAPNSGGYFGFGPNGAQLNLFFFLVDQTGYAIAWTDAMVIRTNSVGDVLSTQYFLPSEVPNYGPITNSARAVAPSYGEILNNSTRFAKMMKATNPAASRNTVKVSPRVQP